MQNIWGKYTCMYCNIYLARLLNLSLEDALSFVSVFKHSVLKRETVVIAMTTLHKDRSEPGAVSCLLVATENREIFIFDPQAFTILVKVCLLYTVCVCVYVCMRVCVFIFVCVPLYMELSCRVLIVVSCFHRCQSQQFQCSSVPVDSATSNTLSL